MGLYLGSNQVKLSINKVIFNTKLFIKNTLIANGNILLSSDGCISKDSNGLYLTTKDEEE